MPTTCSIIELTETLLIPSLAAILFPESRASSCGARCTFTEGDLGAYVERSGRGLFTAAHVDGLY